jgi:hypothetical protein
MIAMISGDNKFTWNLGERQVSYEQFNIILRLSIDLRINFNYGIEKKTL